MIKILRNKFHQILTNDNKGLLICIASVIININRCSVLYNFGVFIAELRRVYGRSLTELNWVGLLTLTTTCLFSIVAVLIIRHTGHKAYMVTALIGTISQSLACFISSTVKVIPWLFLTYSFLYGVGAAMMLSSSTLIVNVFYGPTHKYHVVANTVNQYGLPIATLCYGPFLIWLISISSWNFALVIVGVILFISGVICSLIYLLENTSEENEKPEANKSDTQENKSRSQSIAKANFSWLDVCRRPERILWLSGVWLTFATQFMPLYNMNYFMEENDYSKYQSSMTLIFFSIFSLLGFILSGIFGKKFKGNLICPHILSSFGCGVIFLLWPLISSTYVGILIVFSFSGFFLSITLALHCPTAIEVMDMDIQLAWLFSCTFCGIGATVGPFFSGAIYDLIQSYNEVFLVVGGLCLVNSLVYGLIFVARIYRQKKEVEYEQIS